MLKGVKNVDLSLGVDCKGKIINYILLAYIVTKYI